MSLQATRLVCTLLAACTLLVVACSGDNKPVAPAETPGAGASSGVPGVPLTLKGVFLEPRDTRPAKTAKLPARPASLFQPHDRRSVVLYDTQSGKETNLGEGRVVSPAFSNGRMLYTSGGEAWLLDIDRGSKRWLGAATLAFFTDDDHVALVTGTSRTILVDARTGESTIAGNLGDTVIHDQESGLLGGPLRLREVKGGYLLHYETDADKVCATRPVNERPLCAAGEREKWVLEDANRRTVLRFKALNARPAGPDELVIATSPQCEDGGRLIWCEEALAKLEAANPAGVDIKYARGTTNIFIVNIKTGQARFIATARYDPFTRIRPYNWPLDADANYVIWTENYCGQARGNTRVFDRKANSITEIDASLWLRMANGLLGAGEFGPTMLIDPASLAFRVVMPEPVIDVVWSGDYRYAAVGASSGHGGLCGG